MSAAIQVSQLPPPAGQSPDVQKLTAREQEILACLAKGHSFNVEK